MTRNRPVVPLPPTTPLPPQAYQYVHSKGLLLSSANAHALAVPPRQQPTLSLSSILAFQWQDPESREANTKLAVAFAFFGGAVVLFSQLGDLLVPAL